MQQFGDWISDNFEKVFAGIVTAALKIYVSDITGYVLLWLLVLALFAALKRSEQKQEKIRAARDGEMVALLQDCTKKHEASDTHIDKLETKLNRLRNKYTIILGLLATSLGRRELPKDFWHQVLDEDSDNLPQFLLEKPSHSEGG